MNAPTPTTVPAVPVPPTEAVVGQIGKSVGMFLIQSQYPSRDEQEEVIKRVMMGERVAIAVAGRIAYVHRDTEFDTWYLRRA